MCTNCSPLFRATKPSGRCERVAVLSSKNKNRESSQPKGSSAGSGDGSAELLGRLYRASWKDRNTWYFLCCERRRGERPAKSVPHIGKASTAMSDWTASWNV